MLFSTSYKTIVAKSEALYKVKGSKFFAIAFPVKNEDEFKIQLHHIKLTYPDATHHCYALILHPDKSFQKSSDDGEPANTAGKPILRAIIANDLTNIAVVVVRYFGGTMLGVHGLIGAYNEAGRAALKVSTAIEIIIEDTYKLHCDMAHEKELHRMMKILNAKIISSIYNENIQIKFSIPRSKEKQLNELKVSFFFFTIARYDES